MIAPMKSLIPIFLLALAIILLPACAAKPTKVVLTLSAAASLKNVMDDVLHQYEMENPGIVVSANYASSGTLQQQIEQGADVDVFFSAGQKQMDSLIQQDLMDQDSVSVILSNDLVLITAADHADLDGFGDLTAYAMERVAIGNPDYVPAGSYAWQCLESLGLNDRIKEKLVLGKDVREVLAWVANGQAEAGLVYRTDAMVESAARIVCMAPSGSHDPIEYPAGVVLGSQHPDEALGLLMYLGSQAALSVFEQYGFRGAVRQEVSDD